MSESNDFIRKAKQCIRNGNKDELQRLLEENGNVNLNFPSDELPLLHSAVKENRLEIVRVLINHGVDVNARNSTDGDTALHLAIRRNHLEIADILLANNADANLKNKLDCTPMHVALEKNRHKMLIEPKSKRRNYRERNNATSGYSEIETNERALTAPSESPSTSSASQEDSIQLQMLKTYDITNSGMGGMEGNLYQIMVLILICIRAKKLYQHFEIMPEMEAAGKFDDIVIRYYEDGGTWRYRFIQLKPRNKSNSDKNVINDRELGPNGKDFQLRKYIKSIIDIRRKDKFKKDILEDFIICTTAYFDESVESLFLNENDKFQEDFLLYFENSSLKGLIKENVLQKEWIKNELISDSELQEICDKTYFVTSYPKVFQLSELLFNELGNDFRMKNAVFIHDSFVNKIIMQVMLYPGHSITEKNVNDFINSIKGNLSIQHCIAFTKEIISEIDSYKIHFKESHSQLNDFLLTNCNSKLLTLKTGSVDLMLINVVDGLRTRFKNDDDFFIFKSQTCTRHKAMILEALKCCKEIICVIRGRTSNLFLEGLKKANLKIKIISIEASESQQEEDEKICYGYLRKESQELILSKKIVFQGCRILLKDIFSDFDAKKVFRCKSLWTIVKETQIHIAEENRDVGEVFSFDSYIERTLTKQIGSVNYEEGSFADTNIDAFGNLIAVAGDSGTGKSHFLANLKREMQMNGHWVILLNLNDYTMDRSKPFHLGKIDFSRNDLQSSVEFFIEMLRPIYKTTDANNLITFPLLRLFLLSHSRFLSHRLVILLNGFDEICPRYEEQVFRLVEALRENHYLRIWITTRPHESEKIFEKLQSTNFVLGPFSTENQLSFLLKYCRSLETTDRNYSDPSVSRNRNISTLFSLIVDGSKDPNSYEEEKNNLLNLLKCSEMPQVWKGCSSHFKDFIGNPLQFKMLFELCLESRPLTDLSVNTIYEQFVERKFKIFFENKAKFGDTNASLDSRDDLFKDYKKRHYRFAWISLFRETDFKLSTFELDQIARIGLLTKQSTRHRFIYRSFAEYFISVSLMDNDFSKDLRLVNRIFTEGAFLSICSFFNDNLKRTPQDNSIAMAYEGFVWKPNEKGENILHFASECGHIEILKYFKSNLSDTVWRKLFFEATKNDETVIDQAALSREYSEFFDCVDQFVDDHSFGDLLQRSQHHRFRLLKSAAKYGEYNNVIKILKNLHPNVPICTLLCSQNKNGETIAHIAAAESNFRLFIEFSVPHFSKDSFRTLLFTTDAKGSTILHKAASARTCQDVIPVLKKYLDEEFSDLLMKRNYNYETVLHVAVHEGHFNDVAELLLKHVTEINFKLLAALKNSNGQTFLHSAATVGKCQEVIDFLKNHFSKPEIKEILCDKTKHGETLLHIAAKFEHFAATAKLILEHLGKENFKDLLIKRDLYGNTFLSWVNKNAGCHFLNNYYSVAETKEIISKCLGEK